MNKTSENNKPAPYPLSSNIEQSSKKIFQYLIDHRYIKGEVRTMDKYPNSDGILEMTDANNYPIGYIDIQLKTLNKKNRLTPKYQCDRKFLAYCRNSVIPVFLIVVDIENEVAYWKHIDKEIIEQLGARIANKTVSLDIPIENKIDKIKNDYISQWSSIIKDVRTKFWNYDELKNQKQLIEQKLTQIENQFKNPTNLSVIELKEIHTFLDHYNYILDVEFGAIKQNLYPDYWKIGMGVFKYDVNEVDFLLYPIEFKREQIIVKSIEQDAYKGRIFKEMDNGNVLMLMHTKRDKIRENPVKFSYALLKDQIIESSNKQILPIPSIFIANEYLVSFIDRYSTCLDFDKNSSTYSLNELKYKIYSVLPVLFATSNTFNPNFNEFDCDMESFYNGTPNEQFKKQIRECISKIRAGYIPPIKVNMKSDLFNLSVIKYYINLLEEHGFDYAKRQYEINQLNINNKNAPFENRWDKTIFWNNLKICLMNFHTTYDLYLNKHFSKIKKQLAINTSEDLTIIHILHFKDNSTDKPFLETYSLRPYILKESHVLFFLDDDINNPINRTRFLIDNDNNCQINEEKYTIVRMEVSPLNFMSSASPTYALIKKNLNSRLSLFFKNVA